MVNGQVGSITQISWSAIAQPNGRKELVGRESQMLTLQSLGLDFGVGN